MRKRLIWIGIAAAGIGLLALMWWWMSPASLSYRNPAGSAGGPGPHADFAAGMTSPPLEPFASLNTFRLAEPGLRLELVASEPVVEAPVHLAFDEDGRLWVCEMRTYMPDAEGRGELSTTNRIIVLEDAEGDGSFERSSIFLDGLALPRGVAPCYQRDGRRAALVLEPPSLYFCRDKDGDGRADEKIKLMDGLGGLDNPEHAGNGLVYGIDNWWKLSQHDVEFRFDGEKIRTRRTPNHGQWGVTRDDLGRLYYTPNSNPLLVDVYPKHYAARNPSLAAAAGMGELVIADSAVWPVHATPGVNRGYQEGVLTGDGLLRAMTAACGPAIYRAGELGVDARGRHFRGDAFMCEPAGNLVKRLRFNAGGDGPAGSSPGAPSAQNAYDDREFLASTDERFRPVHLAVGPDGWLYIADMYRGVIQHKTYLSAYLKDQIKQRGLETPINMGRIWRVRRDGYEETGPMLRDADGKAVRVSSLSDDVLAGLLARPDGVWRDVAQRLLVERKAVAVAPQLARMARGEGLPAQADVALAKLHALWTLDGLDALTADQALAAMEDKAPAVRGAGLRLAERFADSPAVLSKVEELARASSKPGADRWIAVQAALSLGELRGPGWLALMVDLLRAQGKDKYLRAAVLSGLAGDGGASNGHEPEVLAALLADPGWPASTQESIVLNELVDAALNAAGESCAWVLDQAGVMAQAGDARFRGVLDRVRRAQRLESDQPRVLALPREPTGLTAAAAKGDDAGKVISRTMVYLDWPGRPPVDRPKRARELTSDEQSRFDRGKWLYKDCAACHQDNGRGSPGLAPALVDSRIALGPPEAFTKALLHGLEGEYEMNGARHAGVMPPTQLGSDPDLAAVMTYVRRAWGHTADPVTPEEVARVREQHRSRDRAWKREELEGGNR